MADFSNVTYEGEQFRGKQLSRWPCVKGKQRSLTSGKTLYTPFQHGGPEGVSYKEFFLVKGTTKVHNHTQQYLDLKTGNGSTGILQQPYISAWLY